MTDDIRAKVAYLQGLAEGLDIDGTSAEGRLLGGVIDVLDDLASQVNSMSEVQNHLSEYVDELDSDLSSLEDSVYVDEDDLEYLADAPEDDDEPDMSIATDSDQSNVFG